ncbi:MAG: Bbp16 family capsid cement protein [Betaproteobacteria bacterium]|jgi:hypothetical protein
MILDRENAFSQSQALTGTTLVPSTDVIDLSQIRQVGIGEDLHIVINFEAAAGGTTPTITVALQTDDNAAFSSAATVTTYLNAVSTPGASSQFVFNIPHQGLERFIRLAYTQGGTTPTTTVSAHIAVGSQYDIKMPSGFTVA